MVDKLEDLYYNRGRDVADNGIYADTDSTNDVSIAFVEYVESLVDPQEVLEQSVTEYHESKYH